YGRELVQFPDGRTWLSPDTDTLVNLPKGTQVIPNKITEKLLKADVPHYAFGTKLWQGAKNVGSKIKSGAKAAWGAIGDVWEYASNPSKLVDKIIDKISIAKNMAEIPKALVGAGWDYVKTKPYEYVKKMFKKAEDEGLGGSGKPAFGWPITSPYGLRRHPITGQYRLHGGVDFGAPSGTPVPSTTAGTVSYAAGGWNGGFGNLVKVRQGVMEYLYAHLSSILVKAGQSVSKGTILGKVGSTGASTGPHLHYEAHRAGKRINPMSLKGFATGGLVKSNMMAMLGEDGEEMVIPLNSNRRTD